MHPITNTINRLYDALPPSRAQTLYGMKVVEAGHQYVPKLKLSAGCPVSEGFRASMDSWLLQRFGHRCECVVESGRAYVFGETIVLHPADYARLRGAV